MKIAYKSETDEHGINVDFFIEPVPEEGIVKWLFFPNLPEGMHPKKGDETGLGSMHDYNRQTYQDFLTAPKEKLAEEIHRQVVEAMESVR
ncbi:MAG: hypothetical protein AB8F34_13700 [Akkermansiaceae bacterium]